MSLLGRVARMGSELFGSYKSRWYNFENINPANSTYEKRLFQYYVMQNALDNTIFVDNKKWGPYLKQRDLHPKTICVKNPFSRVVSFYASHIYPGYLSSTGYPVANNIPLAIPLSDKTPDELRRAIGQIWQWGNWESNITTWITYCASLGDGPVEATDDLTRGQVYPTVLRPEQITDVKFDPRGNVIEYEKVIEVWDPDKQEYYTKKKQVTKTEIRTFRNDDPYGYEGLPPVYENPYGFCPLVWCKHNDPGVHLLPGKPAIRDWRKIEEYNSDYTRLRMYLRKQSVSPNLLAGMGTVNPPTSELDGSPILLEDMFLLVASENGSVHKLDGNLDIAQTVGVLKDTWQEILDDHPEITVYAYLKTLSQTTGPAVGKSLGDLVHAVRQASKNYDHATISLFRMLVAIGGMRANERAQGTGWAVLNEQQKKFLSFNMDSYAKGDLDFTINPRPVIELTEYDQAITNREKYISYAAAMRADIPLKYVLIKEGYSEEDLTEIETLREEERKRKLAEMKEEAETLSAVAQKYIVPSGASATPQTSQAAKAVRGASGTAPASGGNSPGTSISRSVASQSVAGGSNNT